MGQLDQKKLALTHENAESLLATWPVFFHGKDNDERFVMDMLKSMHRSAQQLVSLRWMNIFLQYPDILRIELGPLLMKKRRETNLKEADFWQNWYCENTITLKPHSQEKIVVIEAMTHMFFYFLVTPIIARTGLLMESWISENIANRQWNLSTAKKFTEEQYNMTETAMLHEKWLRSSIDEKNKKYQEAQNEVIKV